jgi:hypothetical protein
MSDDISIEQEPTELVNTEKEAVNEVKDDSSSDDDDESESPREVLSYQPDSDIYVISVDGVPHGYCKNRSNTEDCLWEVARLYCTNHLPLYRTFIEVGKDRNSLNVLGTPRYGWLSTSRFLHKISVEKTARYEFVAEEDTEE